MYYSGYPLAATTTTNSLPAGYSTYLPTPGVYPTPNAQGGSASAWQVRCRLDHEGRDEVRISIVVSRSSP
jgi:hypothetical protein